ncbi:fimbrial protein [Yersinia rochesterensis]|uniref:fimbrial protein n=1 Tax=Yersinia rochesterensis TaxID=1604335 RepID=UPI001F36AC00|nr:fimbrial protein [Yersinia rochesterensis]
MHQTPQVSSRFLSAPVWMGLLLTPLCTQAGSTTATVNFTATFVNGTCQIAVDRPTIDFGSISASDIVASGSSGEGLQQFTVSFFDCSSATGLTPKLKVTGTSFKSGITLFRNTNVANDYSQGYGVRILRQGQTTPITDGGVFTLGTKTTQLSDLNGTSLVSDVSISCGDCSQARKGGNLNATVTFQFIYE